MAIETVAFSLLCINSSLFLIAGNKATAYLLILEVAVSTVPVSVVGLVFVVVGIDAPPPATSVIPLP